MPIVANIYRAASASSAQSENSRSKRKFIIVGGILLVGLYALGSNYGDYMTDMHLETTQVKTPTPTAPLADEEDEKNQGDDDNYKVYYAIKNLNTTVTVTKEQSNTDESAGLDSSNVEDVHVSSDESNVSTGSQGNVNDSGVVGVNGTTQENELKSDSSISEDPKPDTRTDENVNEDKAPTDESSTVIIDSQKDVDAAEVVDDKDTAKSEEEVTSDSNVSEDPKPDIGNEDKAPTDESSFLEKPTNKEGSNQGGNDGEEEKALDLVTSHNDVSASFNNLTSGMAPQLKIVAFTDISFVEIAEWWYHRMTNLSYTTHTLVVIDTASKEHFTNINKKANQTVYRFEEELINESLEKRRDRVANLWYHRILYVYNQLKAGNSILLTDTDNIFTRYEPLTSFYDNGYDAIFAFEERFPGRIFERMGFVVCGGMTFFKATEATLKLVGKWLAMCPGRCNDQEKLNSLLLHEMKWNSSWAKEESRLENGLIQSGFDGVGTTIPEFRARVWDRNFAWRGSTVVSRGNETVIQCPPSQTNWVAMPHTMPLWVWKLTGRAKHGAAKKMKVDLWEILCGSNGTRTIDEGLNIYKASIKKKL